MLEAARRTGAKIGRKEVLAEINMAMRADLGDIISIKMPEHRPSDIIGYELTGTILRKVLTRCEKPETAIASFLLSGPNGAGKTYNLEAYAAESGRVVIELVGLRGMYYGQTDGFFEKLRLRLKTYGKILILVDEAHTQFGSVHKSDTHETEKRLAGNIIKMMSDPTLLGKVVWALGTSRPDELDPDVKSRSPVQIPIFDLEGKERLDYLVSLFERAGIKVAEEELAQVLQATANYSNRDLRDLVKEVKGSSSSVLETLQFWQASSSILQQRLMQTLIAAQHCSYPQLIPPKLKELIASGELDTKVRQLKAQLLH
jgi:SpoVK/Ycf46/Vps4 family AAA+-type ATPase